MSLALTQYFLSFSLCLLPLSLSLSPCLFSYPSLTLFFIFDQMERCSAPKPLTQDHNAASHVIQPAISSLSLSPSLCPSLSISARSPSFPVSLSPPTKPDKGLSFSPSLPVLHVCVCVCLYCTKLGSLSHCAPSFSFQRRCLGALWAPALRQGGLPQPSVGGVGEVGGWRGRCGE